MSNSDIDQKIFGTGGSAWSAGAAMPAWMCGSTTCCDSHCTEDTDRIYDTVGGDCSTLKLLKKRGCKSYLKTCQNDCQAENDKVNECKSARVHKNMFASCDAVGTNFPKDGVKRAAGFITKMPETLIVYSFFAMIQPIPLAGGVATVAALLTYLASTVYEELLQDFKGYLQADDDDFQAAWVKKWHGDQSPGTVDVTSCFGLPNALFCHLLDSYSEGMRRTNTFNGDICAKIDDTTDAGRALKITPYKDWYADDPISVDNNRFSSSTYPNVTGIYGANQIGYPVKVAWPEAKTKNAKTKA